MITLIIFLVVLFISVWLGVNIHTNPGYVLIAYQHWTIETTFWFALFSLIILFFVLLFVRWLLINLFGLTGRWHQWSFSRHRKRAQRLTAQGLRELAEGNWRKAEKYLVKGAEESESPLINYLAAARAAQEQGTLEQRDYYLQKAYECNEGEDEVAVGLTQAQLQLNSKQYERALATLQHLHHLVPNHSHVLKLLKSVYLELQDWQALRNLLPVLTKQQILAEEELNLLEQQAYLALLNSASNQSPELLKKTWDDLPKHLRKTPRMIAVYAKLLVAHHKHAQAEELIRQSLKKHWSTELICYYGYVEGDNPAKQLGCAESWLKIHPDDPNLLFALAQICVKNQLWGKAREYLEASIISSPKVEAYQLLGFIFEQLGDSTSALDSYRTGIQLKSNICSQNII